MVQLRMRMREMREVGAIHHGKLELTRISYAQKFIIPDKADSIQNPAGITTDAKSSQLSWSMPYLRFLISVQILNIIPIFIRSLIVIHTSTIIATTAWLIIPLYLSIVWLWVDTECSIHQVQHTLSTASMECSIHRVQHSPNTASTKYSLSQVQHSPSTAFTKYSIHQVQHSPSTELAKYSIHQVQYPASTAFTKCSILQVHHTPTTPYAQYTIHGVHHTPSTPYTK